MPTDITPMVENTPVVESFNSVQKLEIEAAIAAMEASAVSADQKDALDAAEAPSAANPFVTQSELNAVTLDIAALDPAGTLSDEDVTPQFSYANSEVEKASFTARWTHFLGTIRTWTKAPRIYNELEIMPGSELLCSDIESSFKINRVIAYWSTRRCDFGNKKDRRPGIALIQSRCHAGTS